MNLIDALKSGRRFFIPNKSGKYRYDMVTNRCEIDYGKVGNPDHKFSVNEIMATNYELEPCSHEPEEEQNTIMTFRQTSVDVISLGATLLKPKCKNCGAKIKAEKWVEA